MFAAMLNTYPLPGVRVHTCVPMRLRDPKVQRDVCRWGDSIFDSAQVQHRLDAALVFEWR